ncbi:MAG: SIMPL domain-containing protein [Sandarakinorhabdus sp.]|nr:SIMPL domain-containing protein [Sandarakinorhabdus sp.]
MKSRHFATAVAAAMAAATAAAQPAAPAPATLAISAEAEVRAAPDIAEIGAGVMTESAEAEQALRANAERMSRVVAAVRRAGVAERDIQTTGLNLQPQFRYEPNREPILTGFRASNRVQIILRETKNAGRIIDTLVREGANQIDGPVFRISNPEPLLDRARQEAVRKARARADLYAAAAGLRVKRITSISEAADWRPEPHPALRGAMAMEAKADSPVIPGQVGMTVMIQMGFEME